MQRWGATAVIAAHLLPPTTHISPYTHESRRTPVQCLKRWKAQAAVFVTKAVIICSSLMNPLSVSLPSFPPASSFPTSGELSLLSVVICLCIYCNVLKLLHSCMVWKHLYYIFLFRVSLISVSKTHRLNRALEPHSLGSSSACRGQVSTWCTQFLTDWMGSN